MTVNRQAFVIANWKMNGDKQVVAQLIGDISKHVENAEGAARIVICPPMVYLQQAQVLLADSPLELGAQNTAPQAAGAYTGEVSIPMLKEFDCRYVIIGHSERRSLFGETDIQVAEKFTALSEAGVVPVLCVGETEQERIADSTQAVITRQLDAVIALAGIDAFANAIVAYEPVWAIGTGNTASPEQAQAVHEFIRRHIAARNEALGRQLPLLYGGSVKAENAAALFSMPDIDGGLIGGASLDSQQFTSICSAAG